MAARAGGSPVIVAGVGCGLTAAGAAQGGADLLAVYNTAVYRVRGLPTALAFLPYDDCNALTLAAAPEVLAAAGNVPVLLGFGAHDPRRTPRALVDAALAAGAAGVTNEPFLGLYGADLRAQLEAAGLGFQRETALVRLAVGQGLIGLGYAFNPAEARGMAEAGAHVIGAMVGTPRLEQAALQIAAMVEAARATNPEVLVLVHGGPLMDPDSVARVLAMTGADGYITGSSGERLPVRTAVAEAIRAFKSMDVQLTADHGRLPAAAGGRQSAIGEHHME
jgi:predicted TIM-barrel enzyme